MLCALLETCGRFLYLTDGTHHRTVTLLETLLRLKDVKTDAFTQEMLDMAYHAVKPPERAVVSVKERTPIHCFIRYLLLERLNSRNIEDVLKLLRKLPWRKDGTIERVCGVGEGGWGEPLRLCADC